MTTQPNIVHAAQSPNVFAAALAYADLRISVLPCIGKKTASTWKTRQQYRANASVIQYWHETGWLQNVALVCGRISGNLVVMDLDSLSAIAAYTSEFPALMDTYTVASGSGLGAHLYYYADALPMTTRVIGHKTLSNVELRADGCYVIAPPSIHPITYAPYVVSNPAPILRVPHLREVSAWIRFLIAEKHGGEMPPPTKKPKAVEAATAWARAALDAECAAIRMASEGARNDTLNRAAFKMGQLVRLGRLERADVESALTDAAYPLAQSDGEMSVARTIKSGLDAGIVKPIYREKA